MTAEARVVTSELRGLAGALRGVFWYQPDVAAQPPDQLPLAIAAAANLNANAAALQQYQKIAEAEGQRLGEMLDSAATAYDEVDERYKGALDDPQRHAMVEAITVRPPSTPLPPLPDTPPMPQSLDASGYSDIEQTHALLLNGSDAALRVAAVQWGLAADSAEGGRPQQDTKNWEGDAADAAHQRLNDYGQWCTDLGAAWRRLAEAAEKVARAHQTAVTEHTVVYAKYQAAKKILADLLAKGAQAQAQAVQAEMVKLQQKSDEVRQDYAGHATFDQVKVRDPDFASRGAGATTSSGSGGGGGNPGGGGGGQPAGALQPPSAPAAPQGSDPTSGGQPPSGLGGGAPASGGSPAGKGGGTPSSGGGSPAEGGQSAGGLPGGGLPGGMPDLGLDDPGVSPASTDSAGGTGGGGAGGGAGAGGGRGMPLQPSVGAETVAPAPGGARGGGTGGIPASAMGAGMGGMGGGMGGMGHGGAQQGKEKKRDPNLAPDEELYTEDRPWTEPVIGARRRRDTPDKESK